MAVVDKKTFIESHLTKTFNAASDGAIACLKYTVEQNTGRESVEIHFSNGYVRYANVSGDSKMACVADIYKAIEW